MLMDAFEAVRESPHLAGVAQEFGSLELDQVGAAPRLIWAPTEDSYGPPLPASQPLTTGGRRVHVEAIWTREAGVSIYLFERDYRAAEDLIRRLHLALWEALSTSANYKLGRGRWVDRGELSTQTVAYVMPLAVHVPIYDLSPAELLGGATVVLPGGS